MKPNDDNAKLPPEKRPFRILIISGSERRQYNCPGIDSKSRTLMLKMQKCCRRVGKLIMKIWEMYMPMKKSKVAMPAFLPQWLFVCGLAIVMKKTVKKNLT